MNGIYRKLPTDEFFYYVDGENKNATSSSMSTQPSSFFESSYFIHQRYEDTAIVVFQQQQRKKRDSTFEMKRPVHRDHEADKRHVELGHYGNPGVIVKGEIANTKVHVDKSPVQSTVCVIV